MSAPHVIASRHRISNDGGAAIAREEEVSQHERFTGCVRVSPRSIANLSVYRRLCDWLWGCPTKRSLVQPLPNDSCSSFFARYALHRKISLSILASLRTVATALVLLMGVSISWQDVFAQQAAADVPPHCFTSNTGQAGTIADSVASPKFPYRCYKTRNAVYDTVVDILNAQGRIQGLSDVCDYGWCSGLGYTYYYFNWFKAPIPGNQWATCEEPGPGYAYGTGSAGPGSYCGIWSAIQIVFSNGHIENLQPSGIEWGAAVALICERGSEIYVDPVNPANFKCVDKREVLPQSAMACLTCPGSDGGSLMPTVGATTQTVPLDITIGGVPLSLTYDSRRQVLAAAQRESAALKNAPPVLGQLWVSSMHQQLDIRSKGATINAHRGDGGIVSYNLTSGQYTAPGAVKNTLSVVTGGYFYQDYTKGIVERYNSAGRLLSWTHKSGASATLTYSVSADASAPAAGYLTSVSDNNGRTVRFAYAVAAGSDPVTGGQVSRITAPDGSEINLVYDQYRNLTGIIWPDGKTKTFAYSHPSLPWAKTAAFDENGQATEIVAYDDSGLALSRTGVLGSNTLGLSFSTAPALSYTDQYMPSGGTHYVDAITRTWTWSAPTDLQLSYGNRAIASVETALVAGYPMQTSISQSAGSGSGAANSALSYDARGNVISRDNFLGKRTCYGYNTKNQETVRVEGLASTVNCASVMLATAALPAGARKFTTTWDIHWDAPVTKTEPGSVTTLVYQGQPDPQNSNAPANCSPAPLLPNGAPLNLLCKSIVQLASGIYLDNPAAASSDPDIDKVVLLLHGEDGDGSPVFADSSSYLKTPSTRARSPRATAVQNKFGSYSIDLAATDSSGLRGAFGYGPDDTLKLTGDFTIEMFVKLNAPSESRQIFGWGEYAGAGGVVSVDSSGRLTASWADASCCNPQGITGPVISTGVWHHIALSRASGSWILHLNGVQAGPVVYFNSSVSFASGRFEFGRQASAYSSGSLNGYLDEVRITKGKARYWATFTPPTQAFADPINLDPSVPKQVDPYYGQDILLLHADGANGSKSVLDSSPLVNTGTLIRNAQISTTQSKFGGSSFFVPGSTDYGDNASVSGDFSLPGDFTIEFWMRPSSTTSAAHALRISRSPPYQEVLISNNHLLFNRNDGTNCLARDVLIGLANTWIHVAYVRVASTLTLYVNGSQKFSCTWTGTVGGTNGMAFGYNNSSNSIYYDDIRITKGRGRYTASFVPTPYAFPNVAALPPNSSIDTSQYTYDAVGRMLTKKDTLNRATSYTYFADTQFSGVAPVEIGHTVGDLQSITNAAGHVTQFTQYDRAGRVRQMIDPKGVVTDITYTPRGWVSTVTTTAPGASARITSYTYDGVGQLTGVSHPDGTTLSYSYDAAHRLVGVTDAKGNSISYTLDNAGNKVNEEIKDPNGVLQRSISRSYDALNRVQQVTGAAQ